MSLWQNFLLWLLSDACLLHIADLLIIMDAAVRKQAVVEIAWPNGVSLICIIIEYAAVCLAVWLIHVCIINAGMSRGKDKSSVNVKWNTGAGC